MLENEFDKMLEDLDAADNEFNSYFDQPDEDLEKEKFKTKLEEEMVDTFNDMPDDNEIIDEKNIKNKEIEEDIDESFDFTPKVKLGDDFEFRTDDEDSNEEENIKDDEISNNSKEDLEEKKEDEIEEEDTEEFSESEDETPDEEVTNNESDEKYEVEEDITFKEPDNSEEDNSLDDDEKVEEEFKEIEEDIEEVKEEKSKRKFSYNDILDRLDRSKTISLDNVDDILKLIEKCDTSEEFYEEIDKIYDK